MSAAETGVRYRVRAVTDGNGVTRFHPERSTDDGQRWNALRAGMSSRVVCSSHADAVGAIRKQQYLDRAELVVREFITEVT